jgi:sulfide:quinone oxidoreductase
MKQHVLILGAGFGGLELATRLSESLADEVHVALVDQNDAFVFGFSKLEILFGRQTRDEVSSPYRDISRPGVEFRLEQVTSIDPETRHVVTDANTYEPDILVVAVGADHDPVSTPGFLADGYEYYSVSGAERLGEALPSLSGGKVLIAILGVPFKCPPAPHEGALLLDDYLAGRGVRDVTQIDVFSPMESPIPVSPETSEAIVRALRERDIGYTPEGARVGPDRACGSAADRRHPYDLSSGSRYTERQRWEASGLTVGGTDGWVAVDPRNLATRFPNVYALGDCADAPVPRASVFAKTAARAVADHIAAGSTALGWSSRSTARGLAPSSSAQDWWERSTPTSCLGRRRRRRSSAQRQSWPRRRNAPPR